MPAAWNGFQDTLRVSCCVTFFDYFKDFLRFFNVCVLHAFSINWSSTTPSPQRGRLHLTRAEPLGRLHLLFVARDLLVEVLDLLVQRVALGPAEFGRRSLLPDGVCKNARILESRFLLPDGACSTVLPPTIARLCPMALGAEHEVSSKSAFEILAFHRTPPPPP